MTSRPNIPAATKREIFIESGHRCAVCGVPFPLERAHIVPWCKSNDHSVENLICLCANCHEMADSGWDEKTLREYKQHPWILRQGTRPEPKKTQKTPVSISLDMDINDFGPIQRRWLQYALASFLDIPPENVIVESIEEGSVNVTVCLPEKAAQELVDAIGRRDPRLLAHLSPLVLLPIQPNSSVAHRVLKFKVFSAEEADWCVSQAKDTTQRAFISSCLIQQLKERGDPTERYWIYIALGSIGGLVAKVALERGVKEEENDFARKGAQDGLSKQR